MRTKAKQSKRSGTAKLATGCPAAISAVALVTFGAPQMEACSRLLYGTGTGTYITGRSMDRNDLQMQADFWILLRGLKRDGGVGD